jgi:LacI family transcriptional regulator
MAIITSDADPGAGRVTIGHVARLAGVSSTTVSHVLSGKRPVGAATQERVHEAVRELGYRPNSVARSLRTRRSQMIAVIVPDITNPFYGVMTRGLADTLDDQGYRSYVCNTDGSTERERDFIEDALDRGVDGIVMSWLHREPAEVEVIQRARKPLVLLADGEEIAGVDQVTVDDGAGARVATQHLIARGARRVAMITGPVGTSLDRVKGYNDALAAAGLPHDPSLTRVGGWLRDGGREAMLSLMATEPRPDAVFCANDLMAIGAMDAARELGLRIPEDVALAGFDDIEAAALLTPPLTTVINPAYEIGEAAGRFILDRMVIGRGAVPEGATRRAVLPCRMAARQSG